MPRTADTRDDDWTATSEPPTARGHFWITLQHSGERFVKGPIWWSGACRGPGCWPPNAVGYKPVEIPGPMGEKIPLDNNPESI